MAAVGGIKAHVVAGQRGDRQAELVGQRTDAVRPIIGFATFEGTVAMQRDRPGDRVVRPSAFALELDVQFGIEQPPQQYHGLAGHVRLHLVLAAIDGEACIDADLAPFRLTGEAAELFPCAHLAQTPSGGRLASQSSSRE